MTLATLVAELGAQVPLHTTRPENMEMLRRAGVAVRTSQRGGMRVAVPTTTRHAPTTVATR